MEDPMKLTTKKREDGAYVVFVDGRKTNLLIGKGDPPKYRQPQLWSIGVQRDGQEWPYWMANDLIGKAAAEEAIRLIIEAAAN